MTTDAPHKETTGTPLPPDPPGGGARTRLVRRSSGRVVAGVASGLADHTGIDPAIFRIAFIALAVVGGAGILLYLLAWLVIPEEEDSDQLTERVIRRVRSSRFVPLAFIGVAVVILLEQFSSLGSPVIWAVALIAMGVVLLRDEPEYEPASRPSKETRIVDRPAAPEEEPAPRVRRPRSPLGLYTVGACFLVIAAGAGLSSVGVLGLDLGRYIALALVVVGAGIVVSAWWGRSRLLKLLGFALVPPLLVTSILDVPIQGSIGGRYVIGGSAPVLPGYEVLAGSTTLDLARYEFGEEPTVVDVRFVAGTMAAYVPPGVEVTVDSALDAGRIFLFDRERQGADLRMSGTFHEQGSSNGQLILKVRGGIGTVSMEWADWVEEEIQDEREQRELRERAERREERENRRQRRREREAERREKGARDEG